MILWIRCRGINEDYTWKRDPVGGPTPDDESRRHLRLLDGDKPGVCLWRTAAGWSVAAEHLGANGYRPAGGRITFTLLAHFQREAEARHLAAEMLRSWSAIEQKLRGCVQLDDNVSGGWECDFGALRNSLPSKGSTAEPSEAFAVKSESQRLAADDGPHSDSWQDIAAAVAAGPLPNRYGPLVTVTGTPTSGLLDFERSAPHGIWRVAYRGASPARGFAAVTLMSSQKKTRSLTQLMAIALATVAVLAGLAYLISRPSPTNSKDVRPKSPISSNVSPMPPLQNDDQAASGMETTAKPPTDSEASAPPSGPTPE